MPVKRPFVLAVAAALAVIIPALSAQDGGLTLDQAVEIALARNPEVLAARARIDAARGRTLQLRSRPEPQVAGQRRGPASFPASKRKAMRSRSISASNRSSSIPASGPCGPRSAAQGEDMAAAELDRVRLLLAARVKKTYWNAAFAGAAVEALERTSSRLDALLEDLQAKYRTGAAAYADVLRARAEKARLRNQILEQAKDKRTAELELDELLGRAPGEPVALLTALPFVPLDGDPAALVERARTTLPSFRLSALRIERAESAVKLAGLSRYPDFLAGFLLPSVRPNGWGVSFGLTMPFLRPGRAKGQAQEASAEAEASRLAAEALDRRVRTAVESAYVAAKSAEEQVLVYEKSLLRELEDELGIQLDYFRYGKAEAFSLLDLHRTYVLAQVEHLRALLLYNLALADLEVAGESAD